LYWISVYLHYINGKKCVLIDIIEEEVIDTTTSTTTTSLVTVTVCTVESGSLLVTSGV